MALYEHVFLARQDLATAQVDQLIADYSKIIEDNGGKVAKTEYWGVKTISYRIKKNRKAHYVLFNIDAPHAAVAEMERNEALSEDVIRFMTIRVDELEDGPSAMMRAKDRDRADRGDRGPGGFGGDRGGERGGDRGGERGGDRGERRPPRPMA